MFMGVIEVRPPGAPTTTDTPSNSLRLLATASDHLTAARIRKADESGENRRTPDVLRSFLRG